MSQLETLLRRSGRLRDDQLDAAREGVEQDGLTWVDSLVERAQLDEQDLVAFVQSKLLIPRVDAQILNAVDPELASLVAADLAHRYELLPVAKDELGNLTVAMVDPTDERGVDEVATATGGYVIRAAAPRSALRQALERYYGPRPANTKPERTASSDETLSASSSSEAPSANDGPTIAKPSRFHDIETAPDHLSLTTSIFDALAPRVHRLLLFVHTRGELRGQDSRGDDLLADEIRKIRIPSGMPSRFAGVIAQRRPYVGPMGRATEVDRRLDHAMRGIDGSVLIFPVVLGERVPLLIFGHQINGEIDAEELRELSAVVSRGLHHVITRARSGPSPAAAPTTV